MKPLSLDPEQLRLLQITFFYLACINICAVFLTIHDKRQAKKSAWRVPERNLFLTAVLGGAGAMYLTMRLIRHKTRHKRFMIGLPLVIILHAALFVTLFSLFFNQ